jgi:hypothetical protein
MELVLRQLNGLKGPIRLPLLAPDAATSLLLVEKEINLTYIDLWKDGILTLMDRRINKFGSYPGYSPSNYGLGISIDLKTTLKDIQFEDLVKLLRRKGWHGFRTDGSLLMLLILAILFIWAMMPEDT